MAVRERTFDALARYVTQCCEIVDLTNAAEGVGQSGRRPRLAFTFDDGWADNWTTAFPIAQANNISMTVFVCPGLIGRASPFWPERVVELCRAASLLHSNATAGMHALLSKGDKGKSPIGGWDSPERLKWLIEELKTVAPDERERLIEELQESVCATPAEPCIEDATMSWQEIKRMGRAGVTFGSHTQSHQILPQVSEQMTRIELVNSRREIECQLRKECLHFAYPNGAFSFETRSLVAEAGYEFAYTTRRAAWTRECDPLLIPRVTVWEGALVGPRGRFSRMAFEYGVFWKSYLGSKAGGTSKHRLNAGAHSVLAARRSEQPVCESL
jgi:peptidoglycan/xylan/chitin deacetylase (PgdA/CDA1 family)